MRVTQQVMHAMRVGAIVVPVLAAGVGAYFYLEEDRQDRKEFIAKIEFLTDKLADYAEEEKVRDASWLAADESDNDKIMAMLATIKAALNAHTVSIGTIGRQQNEAWKHRERRFEELELMNQQLMRMLADVNFRLGVLVGRPLAGGADRGP